MLPDNPKLTWPPKGWSDIYADYRLKSAWYGGDMAALANLYSTHLSNPWDKRSGFWAAQAAGERRTLVHVPIASDIASISANLLFGEQPKVTCKDEAAEARLHEIIGQGQVFNTLIEAADAASGLGGVVLKVNWDQALADFPILSIAQVDSCLPEFSHGIMTACTFWKTLDDDGKAVWRLLERHERGLILTGLYRGTPEELGVSVDLETRSETAGIEPVVQTKIDDLLCRYFPNMRPNRRRRGDNLGRADTDGCESLMDSLDEVYTSWLRDVRLGRGRIIVPSAFLEVDESGRWSFDGNQEAFVGLEMAIGPGDASQQISVQQFNIRAAEHLSTAQELVSRIVTAAGYSPQTFGQLISGSAESGAALRIRENRTYSTTAAKGGYWKTPLEDLFELLLAVDLNHLGGSAQPVRPNVEMQDGLKASTGELAQSVELINRAAAASVETRVTMLHPDWGAEQVAAEVARIHDEEGIGVPDITQSGVG